MASCPACGRSAAEHAARGQQSLERQTTPHEWMFSGTVFAPDGWIDVYRCRLCGATLEASGGTTGDTLRAHQRGAAPCPGLLR